MRIAPQAKEVQLEQERIRLEAAAQARKQLAAEKAQAAEEFARQAAHERQVNKL